MRSAQDTAAKLLCTGCKHERRGQACARGAALPRPAAQAVRYADVVGRVGVEPTTSRLSGVRSNHLSYRPKTRAPSVAAKLRLMARFAALADLVSVQAS